MPQRDLAAIVGATVVLRPAITGQAPSRAVPSAGGLLSANTYVVVDVVGDSSALPRGLWYYAAEHHALELLLETAPTGAPWCVTQDVGGALSIILTGSLHQSARKYGARALRYVCAEVGALAYAIDLAARARGFATRWLGGFDDDAVCEMLDVVWELDVEMPLLVLAIGREAGWVRPSGQ
jgi:SagB-type dehydrogenase family enzyme